MHPGDLILAKLMQMFFRLHGKQFFYAFPLVSFISHYLHKMVRVQAEGIMIVSLWPTQPCIAVTPDSRCAKDTSTATVAYKLFVFHSLYPKH